MKPHHLENVGKLRIHGTSQTLNQEFRSQVLCFCILTCQTRQIVLIYQQIVSIDHYCQIDCKYWSRGGFFYNAVVGTRLPYLKQEFCLFVCLVFTQNSCVLGGTFLPAAHFIAMSYVGTALFQNSLNETACPDRVALLKKQNFLLGELQLEQKPCQVHVTCKRC